MARVAKQNACLIIFLILSVSASGQNASNPVQVTSNLTPPYSLYLSDYSDANQNKWNIQLLLKDFTQTNYQAKLRVTIEGAGIRLRTRQGFSPGPIRLDPGLPYQVDATDLSRYLNIQNMEVSGINRNQLASTQKLPEGFYQFKIEVLDYNRNNRVSNTGISMAWLVLNDPPLLNLPFEEKLRIQDPQQVQFQWTPRHTSSPNSAFETEYIFRLWEIWPEGRDPNEVARTTQPLLERTIMTTSYFYGLNDAMLIPGRSYAWQVQATNLNGRDLFKNQGKSEVRWFKYGDECLPITNLGAEALGTDRIRISWEGGWNHNQYVAQIRETGEEEWINYGTNIETKVVYDLQANTEYQIRVLPSCGAIEGTAENTLTLSTPEQDVEDFDCGAEPDLPIIENREPIAQLSPGDRITAAGFTVILTEVIQTGDTYTGMGFIEVPLFNSARVEAMLNDIQVNTDKQLIGGTVESTLNPNGPFILDLDPDEELSEEDGSGEENNEEEEDIDDLPDTDIQIEGEIADVEYNEEDSTITVTDTEGNTTEIDPETADENEDGDIVIEDEDGNVWVVDEDGEVSGNSDSGNENFDNTNSTDSINQISSDSLLIVQSILMTELITYFNDEIDYWVVNYGKGPLTNEEIRRLRQLPSCLPESENQLQRIHNTLNTLLDDVSGFLDSFFETEGNQDALDEICENLDGSQDLLLTQLSYDDLETCEEMLCEYLEEDEVEYSIVVRDDGQEIEADSYVLISADAEMPTLSVEAEAETGNMVMQFRLKIEYGRDIRQDEDYFPTTGWHEVDLNEEWEIDFGEVVRGGRATLNFRSQQEAENWDEEDAESIVFHIRGTNPTTQAVKDYIEQEEYDNTWFFTRMIRQESNYIHFNNGTNYGLEWTDSQGCPNWGPPHGWGLCQLDLLDGGERPTAQELWSWKANVDRGYEFLTGEKFNIAEDHIEGEMVAVNDWNRDNPNNLIEGHSDQEEGNNTNSVTYTHASSDSFDFNWGDLDADSESFLDAVWIKSYNGNSRGYYYEIVVPADPLQKPYWVLNRTNIHDHNYVGAVSGRAE